MLEAKEVSLENLGISVAADEDQRVEERGRATEGLGPHISNRKQGECDVFYWDW